LCEIKKPREREDHNPRWAAEPGMMMMMIIIIIIIIRVCGSSRVIIFKILAAMKAQRGSRGISLHFF
jgi:hypothetical protein